MMTSKMLRRLWTLSPARTSLTVTSVPSCAWEAEEVTRGGRPGQPCKQPPTTGRAGQRLHSVDVWNENRKMRVTKMNKEAQHSLQSCVLSAPGGSA